MLGRISTMDRVSRWSQGVHTTCVLCKTTSESRSHLFFECTFTSQIWEQLTKGILQSSYTTDWAEIGMMITDSRMEKKKFFCVSDMRSKKPYMQCGESETSVGMGNSQSLCRF